MKVVITLSAVLLLSGCSIVPAFMGYATDKICAAPPAVQATMAREIDKVTSPNKVRVVCGGEE